MTMKRVNKKMIVPLMLAALLVITSVLGGVYAKYVSSQRTDGTVSAPIFYFESDLLMLQSKGKEYTLNSSTETISFSIMNYADKWRVSEVDISYTVEVTGGATLNTTSGKLLKGDKKTDIITLSGLEAGKTYTVTVTGKGGFEKVLSATFKVNDAETNVYKYIEQTEHYVLLTVWTENASGTATVTRIEGLIPDNTDARMNGWKVSDEEYTDATEYAEYSSHTYRFFKETAGTSYIIDNFYITVGGKEAIPGTP